MVEQIIPKTIHYCWFGYGKKPDIIEKCIKSWELMLPEYKIIEWNEKNFDVNQIEYIKQAYEKKKYAFVTDYARLWILNEYGGIYVDTDVEVLKSLDSFLCNEMFCGFEGPNGVAPGLILGARKKHPLFPELMNFYENNDFIDANGTINSYTTVQNMTDILIKHGLVLDCDKFQKLMMRGVTIYPRITFCPDKKTRESGMYSNDTYTAHHYTATWIRPESKKRLDSPFWKVIYKFLAFCGNSAKKVLGEDRWKKIRNRYLKKIYDFSRGI